MASRVNDYFGTIDASPAHRRHSVTGELVKLPSHKVFGRPDNFSYYGIGASI